jgi:hypothetical protein
MVLRTARQKSHLKCSPYYLAGVTSVFRLARQTSVESFPSFHLAAWFFPDSFLEKSSCCSYIKP